MLEIRNVTRIYKPKKGVPVKALDNVSLKFPEKGMVFILGKSGSGKSTLLNILGGLDRADKGEIIIKGKSSKDFTQSDFDSYRNTYLGFVFQEYNILNEFTVGANIGLALELQGKKATNQEINRILEEVDLVGYGNRKPTELSGGQKQRVAIARALVKNPEIILADEPTGALDSKTGIQVFETLKKLSKDKLVIVVTHDREYAEYYGDRVIEFKDGRVISDIEKYIAPSLKKNPNLSIVDDKIITIKKGYQLTAEDVRIINEYIKEHNAIISIDDRANEDLRKFARIDEEGNKEAFKETDESKIKISEDKKFRLIKSRLPWKNSVRIGASGLKSKPFRLVLTIILSVVAFTMAGLTDTLGSYNKYAATTKSFIDSKLDSYILQKQIKEYDENYDYYYTTDLYSNDDDIQLLKEKTGLNFKGVYRPANSYYLIDFENYAIDRTKASNLYYLSYGDTGDFSGFYEIDEAELNSLGFAYYGELPDEYDEIAISEYFYRYYKTCGYRYNDKYIPAENINNVQDFLNINPVFVYNGKAYKITAVIDTKFDYERFKSLEDFDENSNDMRFDIYFKLKELSSTVAYGYHGIIFTKKGFINKLMNKNFDFLELSNFSIMIQFDENYNGFEFYSVTKNSFIPEENKVYFSNISKLGPNDIILPAYAYYNYIEYFMRKYYEKRYGSDDKYLEEMPDWYDDLTLDFDRYLLEEFIPQNYPQGFYVQDSQISATYNDGENVEDLSYDKEDYTPDKMAKLDEIEKHKIYFTYLKFKRYYNDWDIYTYDYLRDVYKYY
ncbi:MAG TPA: ABC transporter ATP-binding protein, partial [Clostridia bacterium]